MRSSDAIQRRPPGEISHTTARCIGDTRGWRKVRRGALLENNAFRTPLVNDSADDRLAAQVLAYLREFPDGMETAEGVAEWWVMRQHVRAQVEAVTRVLEDLVARGVLERFEGAGGPRYRLKRT
jgi:hypothetical protein